MNFQPIERRVLDSSTTRPSSRPKGVVCNKDDCTNYGDFSNCYIKSHCGKNCKHYTRLAGVLFRSEDLLQQ